MPGIDRAARDAGWTEFEDSAVSATKGPGLWAWGLCWLMFASTVLNYMDRQAIALVGPQIKARFRARQPGFWLGDGGISAHLCLLPVAGRLSG